MPELRAPGKKSSLGSGFVQVPLTQAPHFRAFSDGDGGAILLLDAPGHQAHGQKFRLSKRACLTFAGRILGTLEAGGRKAELGSIPELAESERVFDPSLLRDADNVEITTLEDPPFRVLPDTSNNVILITTSPGHVLDGKTLRMTPEVAERLAITVIRILRTESGGNRGTVLDEQGNPTP